MAATKPIVETNAEQTSAMPSSKEDASVLGSTNILQNRQSGRRRSSVSSKSPNLDSEQKNLGTKVSITEIPRHPSQCQKRQTDATNTLGQSELTEKSDGRQDSTDRIVDPENGEQADQDVPPLHYKSLRTLGMGIVLSMGGLISGYGGIGQIGGFLQMSDYQRRFADRYDAGDKRFHFSDVRAGTIVGMLLIGALVGSLGSAPLTDRFGRKKIISLCAVIFAVGQAVEISSTTGWWQLVIGRIVEGLGVGGLSVLTPMYLYETAALPIRGAMIGAFQLSITIGILLACIVNFETEKLHDSRSWTITMGISLMWPTVMALAMLFQPESPRWEHRHGNISQAGETIAKTYGVSVDHPVVVAELEELRLGEEVVKSAGVLKWHQAITAPTMWYRIVVGIILHALQQLTGANYFFYYGTSLFEDAGVGNPYATAIILGAVNFAATLASLYVVVRFGRRHTLMAGGLWIGICLVIFASVGHFCLDSTSSDISKVTSGAVMVAFACLAIAGFAATLGPLAWIVCAEIYPIQNRATGMALATASNWTWNFLIGFFTPFITQAIGYSFGYVFAGATLSGVVFTFFCVPETAGKSLEVINAMILSGVKPWQSAKWQPEHN